MLTRSTLADLGRSNRIKPRAKSSESLVGLISSETMERIRFEEKKLPKLGWVPTGNRTGAVIRVRRVIQSVITGLHFKSEVAGRSRDRRVCCTLQPRLPSRSWAWFAPTDNLAGRLVRFRRRTRWRN